MHAATPDFGVSSILMRALQPAKNYFFAGYGFSASRLLQHPSFILWLAFLNGDRCSRKEENYTLQCLHSHVHRAGVNVLWIHSFNHWHHFR